MRALDPAIRDTPPAWLWDAQSGTGSLRVLCGSSARNNAPGQSVRMPDGADESRGGAVRRSIDRDLYARRLLDDKDAGRCFICELIRDAAGEHVIYKDEL